MRRQIIEGYSPVFEIMVSLGYIPSSIRHVKFGVNPPGPPGKAKYFSTPIVK